MAGTHHLPTLQQGSVCRVGDSYTPGWRANHTTCAFTTQVKVFSNVKPVNPSVPPPAVDDGGEGDEDAYQPGSALLGLLGVDSMATPTLAPPETLPSGLEEQLSALDEPGGDRHGDAIAAGLGDDGQLRAGSSLFKGFQKTETVVRRRKQAVASAQVGAEVASDGTQAPR